MSTTIINLNLDPAALLYRAKILNRRRSAIPADVVPLPSFQWQVDKRRVTGFDENEVVRTWTRYIASILVSIARKKATDLSFVALLRISSEGDTFSISVLCPYPEILASPNAAALERLAGEVGDVTIRNRFVLLDVGVLCPLAFVYSHDSAWVLISNEHHVNHPMQFLEVERCDSTSGFLNFIGVLSLLQAQDSGSTHFTRAPAWIKSAMAARSDEWLRWFYHFVEDRIFDPSRILVRPDNPETYFYDYSGKPDQGAAL